MKMEQKLGIENKRLLYPFYVGRAMFLKIIHSPFHYATPPRPKKISLIWLDSKKTLAQKDKEIEWPRELFNRIECRFRGAVCVCVCVCVCVSVCVYHHL